MTLALLIGIVVFLIPELLTIALVISGCLLGLAAIIAGLALCYYYWQYALIIFGLFAAFGYFNELKEKWELKKVKNS